MQTEGKGEFDTGLAEDIFREIDKDGNGRITRVEFVEGYFD